MAVEIQQPGLAKLYTEAALLSRQKAEGRIAQQRLQEQDRIDTLLLQQEHQRSMKLLDSQLDLEMYERSKRWEIDKMELRSRLDFEREEGERGQKLDDIDNALRQIDKEVESGRITEEQAQPLRFSYELRRHGVAPPVSLIRPPKEKEDILSLLGAELGETPGAPTGAGRTAENPLGLDIVTPTSVSTLPPEELQLIKEQKLRVISPEGDEETITEANWPIFKKKGYILADIVGLRTRKPFVPPADYYTGFGGRGV